MCPFDLRVAYEPFRFKDCAMYDPPEPPQSDEVPWKEKDKYGNAVYSVGERDLDLLLILDSITSRVICFPWSIRMSD